METTIMENQMEKKMENEMETGIIIFVLGLFPSSGVCPIRGCTMARFSHVRCILSP